MQPAVSSLAQEGGNAGAMGEATRLGFHLSSIYTRVVREDLRVYENSSYRGFLYREQRAYLHEIDSSLVQEEDRRILGNGAVAKFYRGDVFILKEMSRDAMRVAKPVDESFTVSLGLAEDGSTRFIDSKAVPFRSNYPALPDDAVKVGESWNREGSEFLIRESGELIEAPFRCSYTYRGAQQHAGRSAELISATYSYFDRNPYRKTTELKVRGKLEASILLYTDERGGYFIRERVERYLLNTEKGQRKETGFRLIWGEGFTSGHMDGIESRIAQAMEEEGGGTRPSGDRSGLSSQLSDGQTGEEGEEQIEMSRTDEGVKLNLPNIHFVPDQAKILPEEKGRLDALARLLRKVPEASFLVKGHTADVGTKESQVALSKERAKTIIDELVARGFPAQRFIYKGLGGSEPVARNETEEGRAKNRRVEIIVLPK